MTKKNNFEKFIGTLIFFIIGIILLSISISLIVKNNIIKNYDITEGIIIKSEITKKSNESRLGTTISYIIYLDYKYSVNNKEYISKKIIKKSIWENVNIFNNGNNIKVFYNPKKPENSVIERKYNYPIIVMIIIFSICSIIISIIGFILNLREG
jgi:hypothetical protein